MEHIGYVRTYRKILEWEWFDNSHMVHLFVCLLALTNFQDKQWHEMTIKRGQCLTSVAKLHAYTNIPAMTIRRCLKNLQKTGEITIKTTNRYTIITICKYDSYQSLEVKSEQTNDNSKEQASEDVNKQTDDKTNDKQTTNKRTTTKEGEEGEERKEEKNITPPSPKGEEPLTLAKAKSPKQKKEFDMLFLREHHVQEDTPLWNALIDYFQYRRDIKKPYKSVRSYVECLNNLKKLSNGSADKTIALINQTIANGWQGIYPLKESNLKQQMEEHMMVGVRKDLTDGSNLTGDPDDFLDFSKP